MTAGISQSITGSIRNAIDAPQQAIRSVQNAKGGGQYSAISAAGGVFNSVKAIKGLASTAGGLGGVMDGTGGDSGIRLHASIGIDSKKSSSSSSETEAVVSSISSGNDITLITDKDLTLEGAQVTAQNDVTITADNVIATAAKNSYDSKNSSSSKGMSLGVSYDPFTGGVGVNGNISASKSKGKSEGVTHQNALIASGNKVSITTQEDLTLKGANISGTEVDLDVGKDLTIASVQDTGSSSNSSIGGSFGLSQNYGAGGDVTSQGVSASINGSKGSSEKEWVTQQSSIISKGDIIVRDNPTMDLSKLNRDLNKAQEITKDEQIAFDFMCRA